MQIGGLLGSLTGDIQILSTFFESSYNPPYILEIYILEIHLTFERCVEFCVEFFVDFCVDFLSSVLLSEIVLSKAFSTEFSGDYT